MHWHKRLLLLLVVVVLGIGADQASKLSVQGNLAYPLPASLFDQNKNPSWANRKGPVYVAHKPVVVIENLFDLRYVENPAAAFSLTRSIPGHIRMPLLITVSSVAVVFFIYWYLTIVGPPLFLLVSFCMVVAGALGNLIDRVRLGYVIDFLHFHAGFAGRPELYWPTFNIADSLIVVGAIGIFIHGLMGDATESKEEKPG